MSVPISKIRAVLKQPEGRKFTTEIQNTPHYKFICGKKEEYVKYLKCANQPNHSPKKFKKLINDFQYEKMGKIQLHKKGGIYLIRDGVHRVAILYSKGFKSI